jgi:hypothetical protein
MENKYSIFTKPEGAAFIFLHYLGAFAIPTMFTLFVAPFALVSIVQKVLKIKPKQNESVEEKNEDKKD